MDCSLWGAWKTSTPSLSSNLANWFTPGPGVTPCLAIASNLTGEGSRACEVRSNQDENTSWTYVVGLELDDASITGTLPPAINQLTRLVSLVLTGNPNLTGGLPIEIADLPLNVLDLHDNGFNRTIPVERALVSVPNYYSTGGNLQTLDLSGNKFNDDFPFQAYSQMRSMQVFKLARNSFSGIVPSSFLVNMTQRLTLNLSYNRFSEMPELSQIFRS